MQNQCNISGFVYPKKLFTRKLLEGLKRAAHKNDSHVRILPGTLSSIISVFPSVCTSAYETLLFGTALAIAFHGLLRVGELTVTLNSGHVLVRSDLILGDSPIALRIRHSKTYNVWVFITNSGHRVPLMSRQTFVRLLKSEAYVTTARLPFCHSDVSPSTRYKFSAVLNKTSNLLQLNYVKLPSHSFRIGKASILP